MKANSKRIGFDRWPSRRPVRVQRTSRLSAKSDRPQVGAPNWKLRDAFFRALIHHGDVDGVYEFAILILRYWRDPNLMSLLANVVDRSMPIDVNARLSRRRGRPSLGVVDFSAMIQNGDVDGVHEFAIRILRDRSDAESLQLLANVVSRNVRTGVNISFARRRGRQYGGERLVECNVLTGRGRQRRKESVSRVEIAIAVLTRLPERLNGRDLIDRTGIMAVIGEVATICGIRNDAVRDCFDQHSRQLALQRVFGAPAQW